MSHLITKIDRQQGLVQAWHGLTEIKPDLSLDDNFLATWDVVGTPLFLPENKETAFRVFTCSDDPSIVVGKPFGPEYAPISNARFLKLVKDCVVGAGHKIVSVGSVKKRGCIFVSVQLEAMPSQNAAQREFQMFLNFISSHDGSNSLTVNTSNICTVCHNTMTFNIAKLEDGQSRIAARVIHIGNVDQRLTELSFLIGPALVVQNDFINAMEEFDKTPISETDATRLVTGFVAQESKLTRLHARSANRIDRIVELFIGGKGNRGKTLADLMSGITDYYTHESAGGERNPQRQFERSEFGSGRVAKEKFFALLRDGEGMERAVKAGAALLAIGPSNDF